MRTNKLFSVFAIAILALAFGSCTMVKQHYSSGYYFHKNGHNQNQGNSTKQSTVTNNPSSFSVEVAENVPSESQNTGSIETGRIIPVKQFINSVKPNTAVTKQKSDSKRNIVTDKTSAKKKTTKKNAAAASGGKSKLVALLLCFFLGFLGIHRFYLGYTGMGILYLFTLGLFGIGVIVDFILILFGGLQPKNGKYGE